MSIELGDYPAPESSDPATGAKFDAGMQVFGMNAALGAEEDHLMGTSQLDDKVPDVIPGIVVVDEDAEGGHITTYRAPSSAESDQAVKSQDPHNMSHQLCEW